MTSPAFFTAPPPLHHHHRRIHLHLHSPVNVSTTKHSSSHLSSPRPSSVYIGAPITPPSKRIIPSSIQASSDSTTVVDDPSVASSSSGVTASASLYSEEDDIAAAKIGARVRVKVPLKVYHIPRVPEFDLTGMEGVLKQYVVVWKGKCISANLPFKVAFVANIEGRDGPVKFFAHLKEDEFEYLD